MMGAGALCFLADRKAKDGNVMVGQMASAAKGR